MSFSIQKIDKKSILKESGAIELSEQEIANLKLAARNHIAEVCMSTLFGELRSHIKIDYSLEPKAGL